MKTVSLLLVANAVLTATAHAQKDSPMKPMEYLVGGTWMAQGEIPGVGPYTAERTYRWVLGGKFIEQRHMMRFRNGETETRGILGWDPELKVITAWGFGDDGGIATSRAEKLTEAEICFEGVRVGGFVSGPIRSTNRKVSHDEFVEIAERKQGNDWTAMFSFRFSRRQGP